jgi:hypothetical protein
MPQEREDVLEEHKALQSESVNTFETQELRQSASASPKDATGRRPGRVVKERL